MTKRLPVALAVLVLLGAGYLAWREFVSLYNIPLPAVVDAFQRTVPPSEKPRPAWMNVEQLRVYQTVIEREFIERNRSAFRVVVLDDRVSVPFSPPFDGRMLRYLQDDRELPVEAETWWNFADENEHSSPFASHLALSVPHVVDGARDGWDNFAKRHPGAFGNLTLSRVGFNRKGAQALVHVAHTQSDGRGTLQYFLLAKRAGKWVVLKSTGDEWQ